MNLCSETINYLQIDDDYKISIFASDIESPRQLAEDADGTIYVGSRGSGRIYAIDIQKDLLSKLQTDAANLDVHNIKLIWGDLDEPNSSTLDDSSVDRVVIANILFQLEDKDNIIKEAYRILKPGGKLLFVDWADSFGGLGPRPQDVVKEDVAKTLITSNGFELDRDIQTGDHHYGFILKK